MRRTALVVAVVLGASLIGPVARARAELTVERLAGDDWLATSVAISAAQFGGGADVVLLARADDFPDALAAAGVAGRLQAPVLLTDSDRLSATTRDEIARLGAERAVLLGGDAVLGAAVAEDLAADGLEVSRVGGADRFATAALLAQATKPSDDPIAGVVGLRTVILASGERFPDALSAGPLAYAGRLPVLLTGATDLPPVTGDALVDLGVEQVIVVGGTAAVSAEISDGLQLSGLSVVRLAGEDRAATAVAIAEYARATLAFTFGTVVLARGDEFPDALSAGSYAGARSAPILLAGSPDSLGAPTEAALVAAAAEVCTIVALGGPTALTDETLAIAAARAGEQAAPPGPSPVDVCGAADPRPG